MDLTPYLETLRADLAAAAAPGGPETMRAAELLGRSLEASARLALLEALSHAAAEITTRLPDASVEVRLHGRAADFVVTHDVGEPGAPEGLRFSAPSGGPGAGGSTAWGTPPGPVPPPDGGELARLTLRMPEALKTHVEQSAAAEGISVNAWLVRAVTAAVNSPGSGPPPGRGARPGRRVTGYFQA